MWVISLKRLREFWLEHPEAETPLRHWYKAARNTPWASLVEVRKSFPHADAVEAASGTTMTVFNIAGNKYRLVARIEYNRHKVYIKRVMTHAEYSRNHWKKSL